MLGEKSKRVRSRAGARKFGPESGDSRFHRYEMARAIMNAAAAASPPISTV